MQFFSKKMYHTSKGFTLLELLIVITIIGLLTAVTIGSFQEARAKARDADRMRIVKEIQKALELYYSDQGHYPSFASFNPAADARSLGGAVPCSDGSMGTTNWCALIGAIAPYYKGGDPDPRNVSPNIFWYDADGATPQSYGLMAVLESANNDDLAQSDSGFFCTTGVCTDTNRGFEIGREPSYCMENGWGSWISGGDGMHICASNSSPLPP